MNYEFLKVDQSTGKFKYKITLNVYRDCKNSDVELDDEIKLGVYVGGSSGKINQTAVFKLVTKFNVEPPGSIDCDYYKKNVCIEYGFYEDVIFLSPSLSGYDLTFARCCRNEQNNIIQGSGGPTQGQTYFCHIPATALQNSSPVFYGVPSPYMCVNDTTSFLFDAVDKDGDSLVYRIMRPFQGGNIGDAFPDPPSILDTPTIRYKPGYSAERPFGSAGFVDVDRSTGHTRLYSPSTGNFVVGVEVLEYRNQTLLSRIRMDLQILVLDCIPNKVPTISSDKGKRFVIEEGEELCFNVSGSDPDGDLVKLYGRGALLGDGGGISGTLATFTDTFGTPSVTSEFCWTPDCDMARNNPYYAYFTIEDDGCPPKFNNLDVEIVVTPFVGAKNLIGPSDACRFNEFNYSVTDGGANSTYEWEIDQGFIVGKKDSSTVTIDWSGSILGTIRVREVSPHGCLGDWIDKNVNIIESPPEPIINGKDTVCLNELGLQYDVVNNSGYTYAWEISNATIASNNSNEIIIGTYSKPSFTIRVSATNGFGCTSDTAEIDVFVSDPQPTIIGPITICPNSSGIVYYTDNEAGSTYTWTVIGGFQSSGGNTSQITVDWGNLGAGQVTVTEINRHGCVSQATVLGVSKTYVLQKEPILGAQDVCEFETDVAYQVLDVNGSVYDWTIVGGIQVLGDSSASITADWGAAGAAKITVVQRAYDAVNDRFCVSPPEDLNVLIHPKPSADEIIGTVEVCQFSDSMVYTIAGFANSTFIWSINGDPVGISGQGTNQIKVPWDIAGTFTLSVQETSQFFCLGDLVDTLILVNPKPTTSPISGPSTICPENITNQNYTVTGFAGSIFNWDVAGETSFTGNGTPSLLVDWEPTVPRGRMYVVEISDKGCLGDTQRLAVDIDRLAIDLRVVSVGTPDDRMIIDWRLLEPTAVSQFTIQKRDAGSVGAWQNVASVSGSTTNYLETDINTDLVAFEYRIVATNRCGTLITSEPHTNVLLRGVQDEDFNTILNFSNYLGWDNGVLEYSIFGNDNRNPYSLSVAGASPGSPTLVINNPDQYRKCYRVKAEEFDGQNTISWSNEVCFYFSPEIFVPNAFTANNDNLNDGFGVKGIAINEFEILIYNRWGEKLYESTNIEEKWYPTYRDADVQMGTYIYVIKYSDFENKVFQKTGTINLLR
ncbi:MAG: hypothetical protein COA58_13170 [Bacteroidetes bacterium]|nr:MAG: hypothetical protein COA58_13170 [Bacteroidota bacterium]